MHRTNKRLLNIGAFIGSQELSFIHSADKNVFNRIFFIKVSQSMKKSSLVKGNKLKFDVSRFFYLSLDVSRVCIIGGSYYRVSTVVCYLADLEIRSE